LRKLFQTEQILQVNRFEILKYSGPYEVLSITDQHYHCIIKPFSVHITGKQLSVQYLNDDGFIVSCEGLKSLQIEQLEK